MKISMTIKKKGGYKSSVNRAYRSTTNRNMQIALMRVAEEYKSQMIHMHDNGKNLNGKPLLDNANGEEYSYKYMKYKHAFNGWTQGIDLKLTGNMRRNMRFVFNIIKKTDVRGMSLDIILPKPRPVRGINVFRKVKSPSLKAKIGGSKVYLQSSPSYKKILSKKGENFKIGKDLRERLKNVIQRKGSFNFFTIRM